MEIKLLESDKKDGIIVFALKNSNPAFANTLRKYILEKVPTMAIEDVEFRKNGSVLYDEIIAHRLGLLPLTTDLKSYVLQKDCKCNGEGCARCTVKLSLKAKGPCTVYASELKSKDAKIKAFHPKTPIVKLLKGQDLEFEATAILGLGKDHVKWSPAHVFYKYKPIIEIKGDIKDAEKLVEGFPPGIFKIKGGKMDIDEENIINYDFDDVLANLSSKIHVSEDKTELIFFVESFGQLSYKEIVTTAVEMFENDLQVFSDTLKAVSK